VNRLLAWALAGCLAATGCNKGGNPAGTKSVPGSGAVAETSTKKRPQETRPATPPGVEVVPTRVTLKQGETKSSRINITREGGFDKEIKIEFDTSEANGITIPTVTVPASPEPKQEVDISVTASKDATGGIVDFKATPAGLESKPGKFEVAVVRERKKK
jgi:hypothetical protein